MLLVYLDESFKRHRDYWLAACVVHETKVAELCASVRDATAAVPSEFGLASDVELHGQLLYHGDGEFSSMKSAVRTRVQTYRRALEATCAVQPTFFFSGVDWNDDLPPKQRMSSHRLAAFRQLLSAVEAHCLARAERCLVIADEEEATAEEVVAVVREHQARMEAAGHGLSRVLDVPLFTPSYHSHGIQACDLVAFLRSRRAFARADEDPRARRVQRDWWALIEPHVVMDQQASAPENVDELLIPLGLTRP
jgi:Protein of unknown function (DUF3800)